MPFDADMNVSSYNINSELHDSTLAESFAMDLCVIDGNITDSLDESADLSDATSAALFNVNNKEAVFAQNVYGKVYPASLTKVMTALVALKYGTTDQILTASSNVKITESGAQLAGIKEGDQMTLDQALHILLMYSANDAAIMIAEGVGGSVDGFSQMMNNEAKALGATNTNFVNANGLSDDEHYTTAYDLYLIFNEAIKYDLFNEIISQPTYTTVYTDKDGKEKNITVNSTNGFLSGSYPAPESVNVIGGKTGTTAAAGHCLVLLSRNPSGNPYISIIMSSDSTENLYKDMTSLLEAIK